MRDIIENKEIKVNERNIIPLAEVKEESDVTLNLELYKNNIPFDVTGQSIKLGLLINGEIIGEQSDGITINKNVVTIKLKNSFIQPGKLELDLTLTDNTGRMTTSSFYLIVNKKTIGGTSIQGTDLLETLDQIILDFEINFRETINGIKADYDSLKRIIIDENQAANLQEQININKNRIEQLEDENQAANLQEQINVNKNRIEQLEDLTPVWQKETFQISKTIENTFEGVIKNFLIKGKTLDDLTSVSEEEGSVKIKSVGENSTYNYSIDVILPFEGGLKSLPNGISDEIYDNGKIIQKIEKRVYKTGDELLPNVITDKKNTIVELSEYKTYDINPFFLRTFNKITHLYQENNICGEISFEIAKDRDAIINGNTESISKLNEVSVNQEEKIFSFYEELNEEIKKIKAHEIYNEEDLDNFITSDYKAGIFKSDVIITTPKNLDRIDKVLNLNGFTLKLSDSYSYDYIFRIGETEYDIFNAKYIKWIKNGIIDINDKECYVLNHTFSWSLICEGLRIINTKKGFIKYTVSEEQTSRGAEAIFSDISIIGSSNIKNEQLAYDLWIGDSIYKNLFSQYFTYGVRARVGGSIISNVHVWGIHNKAGRLNHIMKIGVINQAYYNIFENIIVDTPEVLSDELEPSVTNGGIAFYDELSSETRYDNCQILGNKNQKDKAIICFYLNKPENLADEYYGQSMIFDNCFTRETKKIHTGIHFTGKSRVLNITNCNIAINKKGKVRGYNQLTSNSTVFKKDTAQSTIDKITPWSTCNQENSMQMENDDFGITILIRDKDKTGSWIRLMSGIDSVVNKEKVPEVLAYLNSAKKSGISGGIMRNIGFTVFNPSISENNVGRYEYYQYVPNAERFLIVRTGMLTTI